MAHAARRGHLVEDTLNSRLARPLLVAMLCTIAPAVVTAQSTLTRRDSTEIARAVWAAASRQPARPEGLAVRLWVPSRMDSTRAVPLSAEARATLGRAGVPVVELRPLGDDTVVVSLADWRPATGAQSTGVLTVRVRSSWTTVQGTGADRCRAGASTLEQFRVQRRGGVWAAARVSGAIRGDAPCVPVP